MFLPAGYPQSVTEDYIKYAILYIYYHSFRLKDVSCTRPVSADLASVSEGSRVRGGTAHVIALLLIKRDPQVPDICEHDAALARPSGTPPPN